MTRTLLNVTSLMVQSCVDKGQLSDAQIETIIYANQRFKLPPLPNGARCG